MIPAGAQRETLRTLAEWLAFQEALHSKAIDLGLARVTRVLKNLQLPRLAPVVISVAGTNGKGSCVAFLEAILRAAGYAVGAYTSPHILRYNERVRVNGREATDDELCTAFTRVEQARGDISLTYFEFGTLAAFILFAEAGLDAVILEVGLGGRLDAVNSIDADLALISAIGIDHVQWLGADRDSIAREKAGILRHGYPAVCGDTDAPASLVQHAEFLNAPLYRRGCDFDYVATPQGWDWVGKNKQYRDLPFTGLPGPFQLDNAAAVIMVLELLNSHLPVTDSALLQGLAAACIPGRFQILSGAPVECIIDAAHNPHAAKALAEALRARPCRGLTYAVLAMLADKDAAGVIAALDDVIDRWYLAGLNGPRGQDSAALARHFLGALPAPVQCASVTEAFAEARAKAQPGDRVIVLGSFHTVAEALQAAL